MNHRSPIGMEYICWWHDQRSSLNPGQGESKALQSVSCRHYLVQSRLMGGGKMTFHMQISFLFHQWGPDGFLDCASKTGGTLTKIPSTALCIFTSSQPPYRKCFCLLIHCPGIVEQITHHLRSKSLQKPKLLQTWGLSTQPQTHRPSMITFFYFCQACDPIQGLLVVVRQDLFLFPGIHRSNTDRMI